MTQFEEEMLSILRNLTQQVNFSRVNLSRIADVLEAKYVIGDRHLILTADEKDEINDYDKHLHVLTKNKKRKEFHHDGNQTQQNS